MEAIKILLIQIAVILLFSRLLGMVMRLIHQPQVVGEMIAGIMLGPSLLGLFHRGAWMHALFPQESMGNLNALSQLGVMLFMFLVGLELDPKLLRGQGKAALVTGTVGIVVPMLFGAALAVGLVHAWPSVTGNVGNTMVFALFIAAAMSITALPVLARILTERNLQKTKPGALALTCAAINDVMGWCILAIVLAVARMKGFGADGVGHGNAIHSAIRTVLLSAVYISIMVLVVRKLLGRLQAHFEVRGYLSQNVLAVVFLLLIASSVATDSIGIHQIFGAFMLGAVMPKDGRFIKHLSEKVEDFTVLFLLPLFFAFTGLRTELGLLSSPLLWLITALVILTAVAGKFGGVSLAARRFGISWRQSALLGILMNTRGLMELIILNIGLTFGVLSRPVFAMMVVMALITTFMTMPFMRLVYSPARQKKEMAEANADDAVLTEVHVVVPVSFKSTAPSLVRMGAMLMAGDPGRIYALHLDRPEEVERRRKGVLTEADEVLDIAQEAARDAHVSMHAVSFVSRNIGRDITDAARRYRASWVVLGWHKPIFFKSVLGATVGQVVRQAPANVAILVNKGLGDVKRVVVPYLGEKQDRGALLAAERMGRLPGVKVTILHVIKPNRNESEPRLSVETAVDREFPATAAEGAVRVQVVESDSPIELVVEESRRYDLMILGLSAEWNLDSVPLFGKHESVAKLAHCSLLIVHASPLAPKVQLPRPLARPAEEQTVSI